MNQMQPQNQYPLDESNEVDVAHPFTDSISDMKSKQMNQNQHLMVLSGWDG